MYKYFFFLFCTISIFVISGCSSRDEVVFDVDKSFYEVTVNDTLLRKGLSTYSIDSNRKKAMITFGYYNEIGYLREFTRIKNIDLKVGKIQLMFEEIVPDPESQLKPTAYFDLAYADGDLFGESYVIHESNDFENFMNIDYISPDSTEVKGSFEFKLRLSDLSVSLTGLTKYKDTIIFTKGSFLSIKY